MPWTIPDPTADRSAQAFPTLTSLQIETASRFASGGQRRFAPSEVVYGIGKRNAASWLVLEGSIDVTRRDGPEHKAIS